MYKCEILADSMNPQGDRITTFRLTYPRIIHSELMTHRLFSRNASSSRAVPVKKMIKYVKDNMFMPLAIQKAHTGMQGSDYFEGEELEQAKQLWIKSAEFTLQIAEKMEKFGITKQIINRILEPYQYYQVLVTATEYTNFYELRCPKIYHAATGLYYKSVKDWNNVDKDIQYTGLSCLHPDNQSQAEIHIQAIAEMMWDCYNESIPKTLQSGDWHIPFGDGILIPWKEGSNLESNTQETIKVATARCARISYETLGDNPKIDYEADIKLHDRLLSDKHLSCFEHCARAMSDEEYDSFYKGKLALELPYSKSYPEILVTEDADGHGWCNNYKGFIQHRYLIENEKIN